AARAAAAQRQDLVVRGGGGGLAPAGALPGGGWMLSDAQFDRLMGVYRADAGGLRETLQQQQQQQQQLQQQQREEAARVGAIDGQVAAVRAELAEVTRLLRESLRRQEGGGGGGGAGGASSSSLLSSLSSSSSSRRRPVETHNGK
ncbi:MAG: hypothetical protein M1823_006472, partial [Watsoniomyces obsoletus]